MNAVRRSLSRLRSEPRQLASVVLALFLLAGLLWFGDIGQLWSRIKSTEPVYYIGALALFFLTYVPAGLRWQILCRDIGSEISYIESVKVFSISTALNKLLPVNSGDILRSKLMQNYIGVESHGAILGIVVMERLLDLLALLTIIGVSFSLVGAVYRPVVLGFLVFSALVAVFLIPFLLGKNRVGSLVGLLPGRAGDYFTEVTESYLDIGRGTASAGFLLSLARWGLDVAVFYMLALSLNIDLGLAVAGLATSFISLSNALPLTPGGIGTAEAVGTGLLTLLGTGYNAALSLVILQRSIGYLASVLLGILANLSDTFESLKAEDIEKL